MFCGGGRRERELKVFCVSGGFLLRFCVSGVSCAAFFRVSALAPPRTSSRAGATDAGGGVGKKGGEGREGSAGKPVGRNVSKKVFGRPCSRVLRKKKRVAPFKDVQTCFAGVGGERGS